MTEKNLKVSTREPEEQRTVSSLKREVSIHYRKYAMGTQLNRYSKNCTSSLPGNDR